jgi:hypothetical protein
MKMHLCAIALTFGLSFVAQAKIGETRAEVEARMGGPGKAEDNPLFGKLFTTSAKTKKVRNGTVGSPIDSAKLWHRAFFSQMKMNFPQSPRTSPAPKMCGIAMMTLASWHFGGFTVFDVGSDIRILYGDNEGTLIAIFLKKKDLADLKLRTLSQIGKEFNKEAQ